MVRWKQIAENMFKLMMVTGFRETIHSRALLKCVLVYHGKPSKEEE